MIKIKDIYAGKPDAKDEVAVEGIDKFLESYITPGCFNIEDLINGSYYFISGYKGTGKTALLYYLQNYVSRLDAATISSFILFKGDYSDVERQEMVNISKRLFSTISIANDVVLDGEDFECIWRWLFYTRIWEDNQTYADNLFCATEEWGEFDSIIKKINSITQKRRLSIPRSLKIGVSYQKDGVVMHPEAELDFTQPKSTETAAYRKLVQYIERLDEIFPNLQRTDIPYFIFVDELEAYYGDNNVFCRDLKLIRDLLFTIKKLNVIMAKLNGGKMKIICSVRKEIINSINRFVVTKELNKTTSGFDMPLVWNYNNTNSFEHPILKILIKRIELSEGLESNDCNDKLIVKKWFPEISEFFDAPSYILNNSWHKPRDIVRLILVAKSGICGEKTFFNLDTFSLCRKEYSKESLVEIREEMRALYSEKEIDEIISCFTGYRVVFTMKDLQNRVATYFQNSCLSKNLNQILVDLYRLGVIGNYDHFSKSYRWQHKGDDQLIISDEWKFIVHPALQSALSVSGKHDNSLNHQAQKVKVADCVEVEVLANNLNFIIVKFEKGSNQYTGSLSKSLLSSKQQSLKEGDRFIAQIIGYNSKTSNWSMIYKDKLTGEKR